MPSQPGQFEHPPRPIPRRKKSGVDVVLLSADDSIFEIVRNAVVEPHPVWRASTAGEAMELLVSGRCGVLVIDLDTESLDPVALVRQVTQQFPDVVVVAAGRQADERLLAGLISEGQVYRFMHKPLSPSRAGMFLDHAIQSHADRRDHPGLAQVLLPSVSQLPPRVERRYWYAAATAILLLIAALAYFLARQDGDTTAVNGSAPAGTALPQGAGVPPEVLLPRADAALEAGRLEAPPGDNALDLYRDVLLAQPQHEAAQAGLDRATSLVLAKAHADAVDGRGDEARRLVRRVLAVDPANALALAMQARLEAPVKPNSQDGGEAPAEGFTALLRREFARPARTNAPAAANPGAAPTPVSVAPVSVAPVASASPAEGGSAIPAPMPPPAPVDSSAGAVTNTTVTLPPAPSPTPVPGSQTATAATPASDPTGSGPSLVPLREFTRVSTSEPDYPDDARRAGTEGWVRLEFTVSERGRVQDIVVVAAEPRGVFDDAARAALARWRFRPPVAASGQPVALRTSVQLRFKLTD